MPDCAVIDFSRLRTIVALLTDRLAEQDYVGFCRSAQSSRLGASDVDQVVADYGRSLIKIPAAGYELLDVVPISTSGLRRWSVVVPLWTREEGRSDLSLELTLEESTDQTYSVAVEDLHVL